MTTTGNGNHNLDAIKNRVKGIVDDGQAKVAAIRDRVLDAKQQAVAKSNEVLDKATAFIRANPIKAVGIAFAAGYVGMRLFRR